MSKREDLIKEFGEAEMRSDFRTAAKPLIIQPQADVHDDLAGLLDPDPKPQPDAADDAKSEESSAHQSSFSHRKKRKKHKFLRAVVNIFSDRTFCKMLNAFLFCLSINAIEYFFLINQQNIQTKGAISKVFGVIIVFVFLYSVRLKPRTFGLPPDPRVIVGGLKRAVMFSVAIIPAYLVDILIVLIKGGHPHLTVFAYNQPHSTVGFLYWIANILILILINALSAFMLEFLFRGIIFRMGKAKFGFGQTAFIVSLFYSIWYLIIPLSKLINYTAISVLPLCIFYVIFEFFLSLKWCLCVRATGSVWLCIFDHFIFITVTGLLRIVDTSDGLSNYIDVNKYWRYIVYQLVSFALYYIYYKKKMLFRRKAKKAGRSRSGFVFDSLADMVPDDINNTGSVNSVDPEKMDETYKMHLKASAAKNHHSGQQQSE